MRLGSVHDADRESRLTLLQRDGRNPRCSLGRVVTLRPFDRPTQAEALYKATHGPEKEDLWRYMGDGPFPSLAAFEAAFEKKEQSTDPLFFAIVDNQTGALCWSSFLHAD